MRARDAATTKIEKTVTKVLVLVEISTLDEMGIKILDLRI